MAAQNPIDIRKSTEIGDHTTPEAKQEALARTTRNLYIALWASLGATILSTALTIYDALDPSSASAKPLPAGQTEIYTERSF